MAHLFGIRPWEWDDPETSKFRTYGQMLRFCESIEKHREDLERNDDGAVG